MVIGELTAGVRILLKKEPSRYHISEDERFTENIGKFLFCQMMEPAKRGGKGGPPGAHTMPWHGHPLVAPPRGVVTLAHLSRCPFAYFSSQKP